MSDNSRKLFRTDDDIVRKVSDKISSQYKEEKAVGIADGNNKTFYSSSEFNPETLYVYVDGNLKFVDTDYFLNNSTFIIFVTAPSAGAKINLKYVAM